MKKSFKTEGIVLKRMNFSEADQLLTLLSPDFGKISCLAKGALKLTSRFCGRLETGYRLKLSGAWGRNFGYLKEAEVIAGPDFFEFSLAHHLALALMSEATYRLILEGQDASGAYFLFSQAADRLRAGEDPRVIAEKYLYDLMTLLGFLPSEEKTPLATLKMVLSGPLKSERFLWSGQRDSNPRPSPWQGDALAN